jgi:hypothetical protein
VAAIRRRQSAAASPRLQLNLLPPIQVPSKLCVDPEEVEKDLETDPGVLTKARLEAHYFVHGKLS